jgi:hypothetical protein
MLKLNGLLITPVYISLLTTPATRISSWTKISIKCNVDLKNGSQNLTRIKLKVWLFPVRETNHIIPFTNEWSRSPRVVNSHKHDSLYEETKWEKLKDRRNNHKLVLFHKMNYNKTPQYLAELIPKTVGTRHSHNTRQINNIVIINCRTSLYFQL